MRRKVVLLSYFPFLSPQDKWVPGKSYDPNNISGIVSELLYDASLASACVWMSDEKQKLHPVLAVDNALALYHNMMEWAENKLPEWFRVAFESIDGAYGIAVMPRLENSVKRFKTARLFNEEEIRDDEYVVICDPVKFLGSSSGVFESIKDRLESPLSVGLLDNKHLDCDNPQDSDFSKVIALPALEIEWGNMFLLEMLNNGPDD